jgi:hypothetical protein
VEEKKYRTEVMEEDSLDQAARKPGTWHAATRSIRPTLVNPLVRYFFSLRDSQTRWVVSEGCACQAVSWLQVSLMSAETPEEESRSDEKSVENNQADFEVEEAGEESFPASDPPAWTRGRGSEEEDSAPEKK